MRFRLVQKSSTLDDLERSIRTVLQKDASFGANDTKTDDLESVYVRKLHRPRNVRRFVS